MAPLEKGGVVDKKLNVYGILVVLTSSSHGEKRSD